jgi:hypothetical protein
LKIEDFRLKIVAAGWQNIDSIRIEVFFERFSNGGSISATRRRRMCGISQEN